MRREKKYAEFAEVSEKSIEEYLSKRVKDLGGLPLKYYNPNVTGYPDRLLLFPGGLAVWVEVKSKGKQLSPLQAVRRSRLQALGFQCYVCDSRDKADEIIRRIRSSAGRHGNKLTEQDGEAEL